MAFKTPQTASKTRFLAVLRRYWAAGSGRVFLYNHRKIKKYIALNKVLMYINYNVTLRAYVEHTFFTENVMNKLPSIRKILQALYYLQSKAPRENKDRFNRVYLLKMLYVSDRYHLRHFGNLISDDNYLAMRLGPVASAASDVLKKNQYNINSAAVYYLSAVRELSEHEVEIEPQGDDELSESAKEALDFALKEFGHYNWIEQSAISHCYPEWKNHETELSYANPSIPMKLQDFFDDPDDDACFVAFNKNCDPFKDDKDFLSLLKEDFNTNATPLTFTDTEKAIYTTENDV